MSSLDHSAAARTSSSDHADPSPFLEGRLTMADRVRRAELAEQTTKKKLAHEEQKTAFMKGWKRRNEFLAEQLARFTREAGTGIADPEQLSFLEGDEDESESVDPEETSTLTPAAPPPPDRWSPFTVVEAPHVTAWTLEQADLSGPARELLVRLEAKGTKHLKLAELPGLLSVSEETALDAVCELQFFGLVIWLEERKSVELMRSAAFGHKLLEAGEGVGWREKSTDARVIEALPLRASEVFTVQQLQWKTRLPRRVLLPLLAGLVRLGAIERSGEGWQRRARVPRWEAVLLEVLERRGEPCLTHRLEEVIGGVIDIDWTIAGLFEAGEIRQPQQETKGNYTPRRGFLERTPPGERAALNEEAMTTALLGAFGNNSEYDRKKSCASLATSAHLSALTVDRIASALVIQGKLEALKDSGYGSREQGPWWKKLTAKELAERAKAAKAKAAKGKAPSKPAAAAPAKASSKATATASPTTAPATKSAKASKGAAKATKPAATTTTATASRPQPRRAAAPIVTPPAPRPAPALLADTLTEHNAILADVTARMKVSDVLRSMPDQEATVAELADRLGSTEHTIGPVVATMVRERELYVCDARFGLEVYTFTSRKAAAAPLEASPAAAPAAAPPAPVAPPAPPVDAPAAVPEIDAPVLTTAFWGQAWRGVGVALGRHRHSPMVIAALYGAVSAPPPAVDAVVALLEASCGVTRRGDVLDLGPGLEVSEQRSASGVLLGLMRLVNKYVLGLLEDASTPPTAAELAEDLQLPPNLLLAVLGHLAAGDEAQADTEGRWMVSGKGGAR